MYRNQERAKKRFYIAVFTTAAASIITENEQPTKKRIWTRKWLQKRKEQGCYDNLMRELALEDTENYRRWLRMDTSTFEDLLQLISPLISKRDTPMRKAISAGERLAITLRYLATGETQKSLSFQFRIAQNTISGILKLACKALFQVLKTNYLSTPQCSGEWKIISEDFFRLWNFPLCIGALDGKHVNIVPPPRSGSMYFNYKKFHSVVLLALVDANLRFIYVDVGTNGRISDGGVFGKSTLSDAMQKNTLNIPKATSLPGMKTKIPYVIVADDAFPLSHRIMKPYAGVNLTIRQRIYNYRLSRARRVAENAFGILGSRFRIYKTAINSNPNNVKYIVLATCALHNLLREKNSNIYIPAKSLDRENLSKKKIDYGDWREQGHAMGNLRKNNQKSRDSAKSIQETFTEFFNGSGAVPWQNEMCDLH